MWSAESSSRKQYNFVHNLDKWIFYNVAMTEMVILLDPAIALALPNEDPGSANSRVSLSVWFVGVPEIKAMKNVRASCV